MASTISNDLRAGDLLMGARSDVALERLRVRPERALHVGDSAADEQGARAAGMRFAPAPLAEAFA